MRAPQWQRVRELFEQAVEMPPEQADLWLAREEADAAIVAEVRSLLAHNTQAGAFLDAAVAERVAELLVDDAAFEPGSTLGAYVIQHELGRGGMGRVYLAVDTRLGRRVALKVLAPRFVRDDGQRERLRREARAAASLAHPGICTIYALEEFDGHVAIAAEYIDGHSLREEIASGKRPSPRELLDAARELSAALGAAHARGITHRDFKPENVMRGSDGRLKVLDFGLALVEAQDGGLQAARVTSPGMLVGTPLYMAPEQLEHGSIDVRTDVFALGVVLYEFATGVHPFEARSGMGLAARILEGEPRPVAAVRGDLPRQVVAVIDRCLKKDKAARFAAAGDVLLALSGEDVRPAGSSSVGWWRNHMTAMLGLYFVAAAASWLLKEWDHGVADVAFVLLALAATVGGVFRGHLLFAERAHAMPRLLGELGRASGVLTATDLVIGVLLLLEGVWSARTRPVAGVLVAGLGLWFVMARLWIEHSTTEAAFGRSTERP